MKRSRSRMRIEDKQEYLQHRMRRKKKQVITDIEETIQETKEASAKSLGD